MVDEIQNRLSSEEPAKQLDEMRAELMMPDISPPDGIDALLSNIGNQQFIQALGPMEIGEYMVMLSAYMFYLAQYENKIQSYSNWCESNIKYIIGKNLANTPSTFFTEKDYYIRSNEPNAQKLDKIKLGLQVRLDNLKNLSFRLNNVYDAMKILQVTKMKIGVRYE